MNLHVISPGPLTTVQDAGRTGYAARGFRTCGAADGYAMRTAWEKRRRVPLLCVVVAAIKVALDLAIGEFRLR